MPAASLIHEVGASSAGGAVAHTVVAGPSHCKMGETKLFIAQHGLTAKSLVLLSFDSQSQ